jgi:hypothetical protein
MNTRRVPHHSERGANWGAGILAWMGGSRPAKLSRIGMLERSTVSNLFREQFDTFRDYWGTAPDADTARLFWNRARHDAHATWRGPDEPGYALEMQTAQELQELAGVARSAVLKALEDERFRADRASADAARAGFVLTGSDRIADIGAAAGQLDLI